jgi:hypothetical protein
MGRRWPRLQDGAAYAPFRLGLLNTADLWLFVLQASIHTPNSAILPNLGVGDGGENGVPLHSGVKVVGWRTWRKG